MITKRKYSWIGEQTWSHILFLHWSVPKEKLQQLIPEPFVIDTFNNKAWISIVVFHANKSIVRYFPNWTSFPPVTQINVRTYVRNPSHVERGVFFFALHVNSLLATLGARLFYGLPFHHVSNEWNKQKNEIEVCSSFRENKLFQARYRARSDKAENDLTSFLTERYCIWNLHGERIVKIPILHSIWDNLYDVDVTLYNNQLLPFPKENLFDFHAQYSPYKRSLLFPYETFGFYEHH